MTRTISRSPRINKYEKDFIEWLKEKHGGYYLLHLENEHIEKWPSHTRYTDSFKNLQIKTMIRRFGNKKVQKYKDNYIIF